MGAICGIVNFDGKPVREEEIRRMMAAMKHYGPDGSGVWVEGNVGLGSLIFHSTPEAVNEKQPLFAEDGNIVLVCDARIDNRDELIRELGLTACEPDSVLVLNAYLRWRESCALHMVGSFSLVAWDRRRREILMANDHCASRPLMYTDHGESLHFATTVFGVRAATSAFGLDEGQLINYLLLRRGEPTQTFYSGLKRLPAAHAAVIRGASWRINTYWRADAVTGIRFANDDECIAAFLDCYSRAVRAACRSVRPVGIMLSGGLDSSSVAALACRELGRNAKLSAFCAVPLHGFAQRAPSGWLVDESPLVEALRSQLGFRVEYVRAEGQSPWTDLARDFDVLGRPSTMRRNRHWVAAIRDSAAAQRLGVLLSGQAGNGSISWAGHGFLASLLRHGRIGQFLSGFWSQRRRLGWPLSTAREAIAPLIPGRERWRPSSAAICRLAFLNPANAHVRHLSSQPGSAFRRRIVANTRANRLPMAPPCADVGEIASALGAVGNLEYRDPTADRRVLEFAFGIGDEQHVREGTGRMLVRRAFRELPASILNANSRGKQAADAIERVRVDCHALRDATHILQQNRIASSLLDLDLLRNGIATLERSGTTEDSLGLLDRITAALAIGLFSDWHKRRGI